MDYNFKAPREEEELILRDLEPGEFFIFKNDYIDEYYNVNLVCEPGAGVENTTACYNDCLVLDLHDTLVKFQRGDKPVVRVEPCEPITFREEK